MYCVVETIEKGEKLCSAVPSSWVKNGALLWPKNNFDLIRGRRLCIEPADNWDHMPCKILIENIVTFEEAVAKEKDAQFISSTSSDENDNAIKNNKNVPSFSLQNIDLNNMLILTNKDHEVNENTEITLTLDPTDLTSNLNSDYHNVNTNYSNSDNIMSMLNEIKEEISKERTERKKFYAEIQVTFELLLDKIGKLEHSKEGDGDDNWFTQHNFSNIFPLEEVEQLEETERKLRNDILYKQILARRLSRFGGINAQKTARTITSFLFKDELLIRFSWIGTSTKGNFSAFKEINSLLCNVINKGNPPFTEHNHANFMKEYLKHCKTRMTRKSVCHSEGRDTLTPPP